jgi:hypothetical protein
LLDVVDKIEGEAVVVIDNQEHGDGPNWNMARA